MESLRKSFALGCALAAAGCAQGSLSTLPPSANPASRVGDVHRRSGSDAPAIYVFQGQPDAASPLVGLINAGGTMYGTTYTGGANNLGAIYSVTTGGVENVVHSFAGGADGEYPDAPLTNVNGTLFGTSYDAGAAHGTIFAIAPSGSYSVVYNFGTKSGDCMNPDSVMVYDAGKNALYGTAYRGGATGEGCIFKLALGGKKPKESIVYSFTGAPSSPTYASAPVLYKSALYVTTPQGGANDAGSVLRVTLAGKESLLYSFRGDPDGDEPAAQLVVMGNALYGTTLEGGTGACVGYAGCGTVFKITPGGKETVLHRFTDEVSKIDGAGPQSALIVVGGNLIGVTPGCTGNGCGQGTLFQVKPSGAETILYDFSLPTFNPPGYPENPYGSPLELNGKLYGTTYYSAHTGYGTVYAL